MLHWDFNCPSPYRPDHRYGCLDFGFERMGLPREKYRELCAAFFATGFVGWSVQDRGWVFFSAGENDLPLLAAATHEQVERLLHLPDGWEGFVRNVE